MVFDSSNFLVLIATFVISFLMALLLIRLAPTLGMLDHPDHRKIHSGSIPLIGGLAVFIAFAASVLGFGEQNIHWLLSACLLLTVTGWADDRWNLPAFPRFLAQIAAALFMILGAGVVLLDFGQLLTSQTLSLGWLSIPVTVFCTVGVINALNMIDGMDGLSGGLVLVVLLALFSVQQISPESLSVDWVGYLIAALCGFLIFNLPLPGRKQAQAFLGDSGTLFLGFLLAWLLIDNSQGQQALIKPATALWLFAVPLLDTVFVMIKRKTSGRSMVEADREHLHHAFLRSGRSVSKTLIVILFIAFLLAAFGIVLQYFRVSEYMIFYSFILLSVLYYLFMARVWRTQRFLGKSIQ